MINDLTKEELIEELVKKETRLWNNKDTIEEISRYTKDRYSNKTKEDVKDVLKTDD